MIGPTQNICPRVAKKYEDVNIFEKRTLFTFRVVEIFFNQKVI